MADLTMLDVELAEVLGLAQAAQVATKEVAALARLEEETELQEIMSRLADDAAQVQQRCDVVARTRAGMTTAIAKKARETKVEVTEFMKTYLQGAEAIDGLGFLSMTEAGEMAHWEILAKLNETVNDQSVASVVKFAVPLQQSHVDAVRAYSLRLAAIEGPPSGQGTLHRSKKSWPWP